MMDDDWDADTSSGTGKSTMNGSIPASQNNPSYGSGFGARGRGRGGGLNSFTSGGGGSTGGANYFSGNFSGGSFGQDDSGWKDENQRSFGNGDRQGGRGGGGGGRGCFKCGEDGHMSRDCPKSDSSSRGGGGGGGRGCFKCGEEGHMSRECPKSDSSNRGGGGGRGCFKCGEEGHMSRECPNPGSGGRGGGGGSRACYKCNQEGHMSRDCPNGDSGGGGNRRGFGGGSSYENGESGGGGSLSWDNFNSFSSGNQSSSGGGGAKKGCFKCGEEGHFSRECPNTDGGNSGAKKSGCFKCGEDGHMSRDCPNPNAGGDGGRKSGCFKCGEDGHMAKDCTKPSTGPDGKPREVYIPPELPEENLYETIPSGINFEKYDRIPVKVTGNDPPFHIETFESSFLREILLDNVRKANYKKPTPVQKYAIPIVMSGRDLMACAQTGSGKTAAFILPILHKMLADGIDGAAYNIPQEPYAVIMSPTRELAIQIYKECCKFSHGSIIRPQISYGGTSSSYQSKKIINGCHILVATPGRLLDFVDKGTVSFKKVKFLVLDEADRMLDMGFMPEVKRMVHHPSMPDKGERQTLMFSATFPEEIQHLAREFLNDYLFLAVGMVGSANEDVRQDFFQVEKHNKREKLMEILNECGKTEKTLVFVKEKRMADFIATYTSTQGLPTTSIHGDRLQREREEALADFKAGRMPILVATAVAARGLDIKDVAHVINYDLPEGIDEYVHRIGRTGRVGNLGRATSFFDMECDIPLARPLVDNLKQAGQNVPDWLERCAQSSTSFSSGGPSSRYGGRDIRRFGGGGGGGNRGNRDGDDFGGSGNAGGGSGNSYNPPQQEEEEWD